MAAKTRYFVIASLVVLMVGIGTGLVAYYVGFSPSPQSPAGGLDELRLIPRNASVVAYAGIHEVMISALRQRLRDRLPITGDGQQELAEKTGINLESDVDYLVAGLVSSPAGQSVPAGAVVLVHGRFNDARIVALMLDHGAEVQEYKGKRVIAAPAGSGPAGRLSLAFLGPELVAIGSTELVRAAVDLDKGGDSVTSNDEMMRLMRSLEPGNVWAIGRPESLRLQNSPLPSGLADQLSPISRFGASGNIDSGIRGVLRAETRDEEAATSLRDVVRGFIAVAKIEVGSRPELKAIVDSLDVRGTGTGVSLAFDVPLEALDLIGTTAPRAPKAR